MKWALVDRAANCVGASSDPEAATRNILLKLPTESREEFSRMLDAACEDGQRRRLTITRAAAPLQVVDVVPLRTSECTDYPALVLLYDEDDFDSSQNRLAQLARRNEAILRCSMDGFFVVNQDCRFLEVNEAFCRMTGYSADELMRMRITELEAEEQADGAALHTETGLHHFPTAHRHKNGQIIHLEISINVLHDNGAKVLVGFARDITERRRNEAELARLTREQQSILDSVGEGIAGLDQEGRITFVNPAAQRMLGADAAALFGRAASELFAPRATDAAGERGATPVDEILKQQAETLGGETEFQRGDGTRLPVAFTLAAMRIGQAVDGAVLSFRDLTEQKRIEQERRELEAQIRASERLESLGLLAGGIAHDLNNTLTGIQGNASLAIADLTGEPEVRIRIERIVAACKRASKVVDQVLASAGRKQRHVARLELNELVRETTDFVRPTAPRNIDLALQLHCDTLTVAADGGQLQQVFTNLIVNAIEAIGDRAGYIMITTGEQEFGRVELDNRFTGQDLEPGTYAVFQIEDTGCGMDADTARRIFEPFFSTKRDGRGLGLAALRGVVHAHHGGVRVDSETDKGTRFEIVLPLAEQPAAERFARRAGERESDRPVVLVIDDDNDVREVISDVLKMNGLDVLTADCGVAGVAAFEQHAGEVDLVLLDLIMPDKSGWDVFKELIAVQPDIKVILISGYIKDYRLDQLGGQRPVAIINKPFMNDALIETVRGALAPNGATSGRRDGGVDD